MHIQDIFQKNPTTFSFEFFPPKTPEAAEILYQTIRELEDYRPHFVSVTYGAGGSTRELTHDLVVRIKSDTTLESDPSSHLRLSQGGGDRIHARTIRDCGRKQYPGAWRGSAANNGQLQQGER